jgi:hypothetical protein
MVLDGEVMSGGMMMVLWWCARSYIKDFLALGVMADAGILRR